MMKKILLILLLAFLMIPGFSQKKIPIASQSEIQQFLNSTTYIVLKNAKLSLYNLVMQEVAEKFWTITPYEFIYESDFHNKRHDKSKSFLVINQFQFENDRKEDLFDFLVLTIGGNAKTINDMPSLCAVPLCYHGDDKSDYEYKLGLFIKFIQKHIQICKDNPDLNENNIANFYLKKSDNLRSKTFYVLRDELDSDIRNRSSFKNIYTHNFIFSTKEKIEELINKSDPNAVFLHMITPNSPDRDLSLCIKIIMDTNEGNLYYYDSHSVSNRNPAAFLRSDLRAFSRR